MIDSVIAGASRAAIRRTDSLRGRGQAPIAPHMGNCIRPCLHGTEAFHRSLLCFGVQAQAVPVPALQRSPALIFGPPLSIYSAALHQICLGRLGSVTSVPDSYRWMQLPRSGTSIKSTATQTEICWGTQDFAVHVLTSMHQRTAPISPSAERHPAFLSSYTGRRNTHPCTDTLVISVWCTRNNHLRCGTLQERSILAGSVRTGLHKKRKDLLRAQVRQGPQGGAAVIPRRCPVPRPGRQNMPLCKCTQHTQSHADERHVNAQTCVMICVPISGPTRCFDVEGRMSNAGAMAWESARTCTK